MLKRPFVVVVVVVRWEDNKALMFKPIDYINVKPAQKKNTESSLKTGCETLMHPVKYCTSYAFSKN